MKARRIGNGKGVDAIENVIVSMNSYKSARAFMASNSVENNMAFVEYVRVMRVVAEDTSKFIIDIQNGKIDDGDIMDYIIESKDDGFMDNVESIQNECIRNIGVCTT